MEALYTQYAVWLLLLVLPFRKIPVFFANPVRAAAVPDPAILLRIRQAAGYATLLSFWKNKCLVQSLTARRMLSRRHIRSCLSLGVMHGQNHQLLPHAWLTAGDEEIVSKSGPFKELYSF